ncbi:MAG TPA: aminotransferase class I/II-fold pyridoxal phosphate-dependent enzyme [Candidatus Acidoferrum sp.]|nr:aminotransferase class I/II-fold pyridoxal phosphate-dependent enzyme [Candidatus Acidoferrum sp.]
MTQRQIATRVSQLNGEGALAVFSRAKELERQGRSIIHLELGEPDFHPAAPVVDSLRNAVASGRDRYCATRGILALREEIAHYLARTRQLTVQPDQVLVAPGCKMALSLAMMALIEPGDEVLYPNPGFPIYPSFTRGLGATAVPFALREENQFQPDLAEIAAKITPKTRVLILNSPNNPTGTVFDSRAIAGIAALAIKHDLWVITDEIYARIVFNGDYHSIWSIAGMPERTVIIDGFSKSFAMTGWRLGYAVAPVALIDAMDLLVLNTFTCAAEFTQVAAIEALRDSTNAVDAMVAEYRLRRDLFVKSLAKIPGFRCQWPEGAFYAWVNIEDTGLAAEKVQQILLEEAGVAAIAGAAFGAEGKNYRVSRW